MLNGCNLLWSYNNQCSDGTTLMQILSRPYYDNPAEASREFLEMVKTSLWSLQEGAGSFLQYDVITMGNRRWIF